MHQFSPARTPHDHHDHPRRKTHNALALLAVPLLLLLSAGCEQPYEPLNGGDTDGLALPEDHEALGREAPKSAPPVDEPCAESEVIGPLPIVIATNTFEQGQDFDPTCAQAGADVAFLWTAPHAGDFTFSTQGSQIDTVLSAYRPECGGQQLACNDDAGLAPGADEMSWSEFTLRMDEGQVIALSVAGVDESFGPVRLTIDELR